MNGWSRLKLSPLLYMALPLFGSLLLAMLSFQTSIAADLWPLLAAVSALSIFEITKLYKAERSLNFDFNSVALQTPAVRLMALVFAWTIIVFCCVDLATHGLVILNPDPHAYSTFTPTQSHIRHITLMCWTLAPLALLPALSQMNRATFLFVAIVFPVVAVDRNRILATFGSLATMYLLFPALSRTSLRRILKIGLAVFVGAAIFSVLGGRRSSDTALNGMLENNRSVQEANKYPGQSAYFEKLNQACPLPKQLPLNSWFTAQNPRLKWILTYITAPIFNLQTLVRCGWHSADYLKWQVVPFWQRTHREPPPLPLVSPYLNVGTEFLPFYLAGGWMGVITALALMWTALTAAASALVRWPNIFTLLIFLRLTYCAVTSEFAPQFFTWTTIGFVVLCGVLSAAAHGKKLTSRIF